MFGLFWWVMFVLPTIRDAAACALPKEEKLSDEEEFAYSRGIGVRREPAAASGPKTTPYAHLRNQTTAVMVEDEVEPEKEIQTPLHLMMNTDAQELPPPDEIDRIAQLMLISIVGYFVAGWFLSRAYIMTLFIYGGMVQVIYSMALARNIAKPRMKAIKIIQYSAMGSVGLIFVVYIMLRLQHLTSH
jgi:hypothetical protein